MSRPGGSIVVVTDWLRGDAVARALGQKMLAAFRHPFESGGQSWRVGLTIG